MSATKIPAAEFQFGVAGRSETVQMMIADGRLRRLPSVMPPTRPYAIGAVRVARIAHAPENSEQQSPQTAELPNQTTIRR
jgi:hypothetical protein